jgi:hypothetical protein
MNLKLRCVCIFVMFGLFSFSVNASPISDLQDKVDKLGIQLKMVEQNQINYQVERDLLKETYSSNFETINIVLTIILGLFSIIGFLGIRDISSLRTEYKVELGKLTESKKILDKITEEIGTKQETIIQQGQAIEKINEDQDRRIKILEIQEKAGTLIDQNNPQRALEYLAIGLDLDPKNILVINLQAKCFWKLRNYSGAIEKFEYLCEIDKTNEKLYKQNLLELYLFNNQIKKFDELFSLSLVDGNGNGVEITLEEYLKLLKRYVIGQSIFTELIEKMKGIDNIQKEYFSWGFGELQSYLNGKKESKDKKALLSFINVIMGKKLPLDVVKEIEGA